MRHVVSQRLTGLDLDTTPVTDGALDAGFLTLEVAEVLRHAGPWGQHFPEPVFDGEFELLDQRIVGGAHLKMRLRPLQSDGVVKAIAFRCVEEYATGSTLQITYRLDVDDYGPTPAPQLIVNTIESL